MVRCLVIRSRLKFMEDIVILVSVRKNIPSDEAAVVVRGTDTITV